MELNGTGNGFTVAEISAVRLHVVIVDVLGLHCVVLDCIGSRYSLHAGLVAAAGVVLL